MSEPESPQPTPQATPSPQPVAIPQPVPTPQPTFQADIEKLVDEFPNVKNSCMVVRHAGGTMVSVLTPMNKFILELRPEVGITNGNKSVMDFVHFSETTGQVEINKFTDVCSLDTLRKFIAIIQMRISSFLVARETLVLVQDIRDCLKPIARQTKLLDETNVYLRKLVDAFDGLKIAPRA